MENQKRALFRLEALETLRQKLHGEVLLLPKLSHTLIVGLLLLWFIVVLIWASLSTFSRKETVNGWLEPPTGVTRVFTQASGTVKSVLVEEGQLVEKGQPLIEISEQKTLTGGIDLQLKRLQEFDAQIEIIERQLSRNKLISAQQKGDLEKRITTAKSELELVEKQISILNQRYRLVRTQVKKAASLRKEGHLSATEYDQTVSEKLSLEEEIQSLKRIQLSQRTLIGGLESELRLSPEQEANQIDQLQDKLSILSQQKSELQQRRSYTLVAARAGVVNNLQVFEGEHVQANQSTPLLSILPKHASLKVQLLVPARSAGFVEPNQPLYIRYDAFPFQKFGLYEGRIDAVSRTIMLPGELLNSPISITEPVYRVSARLSHNDIKAYGKSFALRPGMTLSADIELEERSVIEWLFEPLLSVRGNL